jgi:hypothetical protein
LSAATPSGLGLFRIKIASAEIARMESKKRTRIRKSFFKTSVFCDNRI